MHLSRVVWIWKAKWDNWSFYTSTTESFKYNHIKSSLQKHSRSKWHGIKYYAPNLYVHNHVQCIACVIIKEWKQKDDLFHYTESDTQSSYVFDPFNALNDDFLQKWLMTSRLNYLSVPATVPNNLALHDSPPDEHTPGQWSHTSSKLHINIWLPLPPSACCLVRPALGAAGEPPLQHVHWTATSARAKRRRVLRTEEGRDTVRRRWRR